MTTKCPNCGAENPDYVQYCGTCAAWVRESEPSSGSSVTLRGSEDSSHTTTLKWTKSLGSSLFSWAAITTTVSLVLLVAGLILYIYYAERYLSLILHFDISEYRSLLHIYSVSEYATDFGFAAAVLGFIFIFQGVIHRPENRQGSALLSHIHLTRIKWLLLLALALLCITALVKVWLYNVNISLGYGTSMRIYYLPRGAWVLLTAALLFAAVDLRKAADAEPPLLDT